MKDKKKIIKKSPSTYVDLDDIFAAEAEKIRKEVKEQQKKYFHKKLVTAGGMVTTKLYKGRDGFIYRKLNNGKIEKMVEGRWNEIKVNYDFLNNEKFREY
jgi:hypothetical protein